MQYTGKIASFLISLVLVLALLAVAILTYGLLTSSSEPVVKTNVGTFQGLHVSDGDYDMYLGIPYAQVNMSNVFGPAIPQNQFSNLFVADNDSSTCPQYNEVDKSITGSMDCLRLNVFTPKFTKTKQRHSVLAFINENDCKFDFNNSSLCGPKYLMKHGIVLVTINYRLGPYGFLCLDKLRIANQGLKDQILALKWIRNNIVHFGGDPRKVTIAGVGRGGECVNLHLMYGNEELFQKYIVDSGIFLKASDRNEDSQVLELAEELDFEGDSESDALHYLNEQSIKSVLTSSVKLNLDFGPCIEGEYEYAYITRNTTFQNIRKVPLLISHSDIELPREYWNLNLDQHEFRDLFYDELEKHFDLDDDELRKMEKHVHDYYIKDERIGERSKQGVVNFASDLYYNYPTKRMIEKYFEDEPYKVYYAVFSYPGKRNFGEIKYNISTDGAIRGDLLRYLFGMNNLEQYNDDDQQFIDNITTLWTNFVKYGNPTPLKNFLVPVIWAPVTKGKLNYLEISSSLTNKIKPFNSRIAFWDMIYKLYGNQERITKDAEPWRSDD